MIEVINVYKLFNKKFRRDFWILIFLTLISVILEAIGVSIIVPLIALFNSKSDSFLYSKIRDFFYQFNDNLNRIQVIEIALILVLLFFLLKNIFLVFCIWLQNTFSNNFINYVTNRLFQTYITQPYIFHLDNNSSVLIKNVVGEVEALRDIVVNAITFISEIFVISSIVFLLIYFEPTGSIAIFSLVVCIVYIFSKFTKKHVTQWGKAKSIYLGLLTKNVMEALGGIKDIIILGREGKFLNEFKNNYTLYSNSNRKNVTLSSLPRLFLEFLSIFSLTLMSLILILQNKSSDSIIPILSLFAFSAFRLMPSINKVFNAVQHIRFCLPSVPIISNTLKLDFHTLLNGSGEKFEFSSVIEIKNISFYYSSKNNISLNNISFEIKKNSTIGIIGESGSGKSTLVDILLGLLTPQNGEIIVDGENIHQSMHKLRSWQNNIGYVPQQIYLTDDTIRNNIALGISDNDIDYGQIENVVRACQLEEYIQGLSKGLDTIVGERGARLSGGQRQRIGIARALYSEPSILVFDEATSSLDIETEKSIITLMKSMTNKTVIIVAHRLSTIEHCDLVIRLQNGNITDIGSYNQVVNKIY